MLAAFAAAQIALTVVFLFYASYRDYRVREVSDRVWIIYAPIALVISLADFLLYEPSELPFFGLSVGVTVGFSLLLFYSSGFGGADAKAFWCIAISLPFFPPYHPLIPSGLSPLAQTIFPITILTNSALVAASSGIFLLFWNIIKRGTAKKPFFQGSLAKAPLYKKILVLVTGVKFPLATLKAKWHIYPLEDAEEAGEGELKRKLMVFPKDEGRDQVVERLEQASKEGKIDSKVWATPGLPMLIFVTVGLFLALTLGDVVWILVSHLFG